ncbi:hypothetical protein WL11_30015 [Burkholderia ubonensis]|nr:hypothetical protein WL11_30015 [Burkholderia ubonensis]
MRAPLTQCMCRQGNVGDRAGRVQVAAGEGRHDSPPAWRQIARQTQRRETELVGAIRFVVQIEHDRADLAGHILAALTQGGVCGPGQPHARTRLAGCVRSVFIRHADTRQRRPCGLLAVRQAMRQGDGCSAFAGHAAIWIRACASVRRAMRTMQQALAFEPHQCLARKHAFDAEYQRKPARLGFQISPSLLQGHHARCMTTAYDRHAFDPIVWPTSAHDVDQRLDRIIGDAGPARSGWKNQPRMRGWREQPAAIELRSQFMNDRAQQILPALQGG